MISPNYFNQSTDRLTLRALTEADIPAWLAFFENNNRLHYLGIDLKKNHETIAKEWIVSQFERYRKYGVGHLAVELTKTRQLIGLAGLIPRELDQKSEIEIAFSFIPKYWGNGFATEVAEALKFYAFQNLNPQRLISIIEINNTASANVARKNGMSVLFQTQFLGMKVDVFGISKKDL